MENINGFMLELDAAFSHVIPRDMSEILSIAKVNVAKINDQILHGLSFKTKDVDEAPTFYIDQYYDDYLAGRIDPRSVAQEIYDLYKSVDVEVPVKASEIDFSLDGIGNKIGFRVLQEDRNKTFLQDKPYKALGNGLAAVFVINFNDEYAVTVNDKLLEEMNTDIETLYEKSMANAYTIDPPVLRSMEAALFGDGSNLLQNTEPIPAAERGGMYVLTNSSGVFGASNMMHPEIMKEAAEIIGEDVYVLPSSLHEVILVPESSGVKLNDLSEMVRQANRTVVDARDVLSDEVYYYNVFDHKFSCLTMDEKYDAAAEIDIDEEEFEM